eukprot:1592328-Prymnesium_polylepis.1
MLLDGKLAVCEDLVRVAVIRVWLWPLYTQTVAGLGRVDAGEWVAVPPPHTTKRARLLQEAAQDAFSDI